MKRKIFYCRLTLIITLVLFMIFFIVGTYTLSKSYISKSGGWVAYGFPFIYAKKFVNVFGRVQSQFSIALLLLDILIQLLLAYLFAVLILLIAEKVGTEKKLEQELKKEGMFWGKN